MKEISLNILDIAENSVKAKASLTEIYVTEEGDMLTLIIKDDGCGMDEETVRSVTDPFYTTRKTRSVGLGIPLLKLACEQTGGSLDITSSVGADNHGTALRAIFFKNHIDFTPLGDVISSVTTLIQGHPDTDFLFCHTTEAGEVSLDTREIRAVLEDVPLDTYEVICWIRDNLEEQYNEIKTN
jgi:signal transduction histidine kinase